MATSVGSQTSLVDAQLHLFNTCQNYVDIQAVDEFEMGDQLSLVLFELLSYNLDAQTKEHFSIIHFQLLCSFKNSAREHFASVHYQLFSVNLESKVTMQMNLVHQQLHFFPIKVKSKTRMHIVHEELLSAVWSFQSRNQMTIVLQQLMFRNYSRSMIKIHDQLLSMNLSRATKTSMSIVHHQLLSMNHQRLIQNFKKIRAKLLRAICTHPLNQPFQTISEKQTVASYMDYRSLVEVLKEMSAKKKFSLKQCHQRFPAAFSQLVKQFKVKTDQGIHFSKVAMMVGSALESAAVNLLSESHLFGSQALISHYNLVTKEPLTVTRRLMKAEDGEMLEKEFEVIASNSASELDAVAKSLIKMHSYIVNRKLDFELAMASIRKAGIMEIVDIKQQLKMNLPELCNACDSDDSDEGDWEKL